MPGIRHSFLIPALAIGAALASAQHASAGVAQMLETYQHQSEIPAAELDSDSLARLVAGEVIYRKVVVTRVDSTDDDSTTLRIIGYRVIDKARESLWLAALAYDAGFSGRLTEFFVATNDVGGASWYQHVNMPWPLKNRHWMIETAKDLELAAQSDNRLWEHNWQLVDNVDEQISDLFDDRAVAGISVAQAAKAISLPLNNGAWVMGELGTQQTLVIVHATMDMGGVIPDGLVARYTRRQLQSMLKKIERDADSAHQRYDERYVIYRGDGTPIAPGLSTANRTTSP